MSTRADQMDEDTEADYRESFENAQTPEEALVLVRDYMEPVQGANPTNEAMSEMLERIIKNAEPILNAEELAHLGARSDLNAVKGKVIIIPVGASVSGYNDDEMFEEIKLTSPAIIRVDDGTVDNHTPGIELTDPTWDVALMADHPQLSHLGSLTIYGPNYSRKTGKLDIFRPQYPIFEGEVVRIMVRELAAPRVEELTVAVERPVYNGLLGMSSSHKDGGLIRDAHDGLTPVLEAIRAAGFEGNDTTRVKIVQD